MPNPPSRAALPSTATVDEVFDEAVGLVRHAVTLGARLAEQTGLHPTDVRALQVLDLAADQDGVAMGQLAQALSLTPQAVTALVARLESRGLARRESDPHDRRRTRVVLAPAARAFGQEHLEPLAARLRRSAAALQPAERAAVVRFLAGALDEAPDE